MLFDSCNHQKILILKIAPAEMSGSMRRQLHAVAGTKQRFPQDMDFQQGMCTGLHEYHRLQKAAVVVIKHWPLSLSFGNANRIVICGFSTVYNTSSACRGLTYDDQTAARIMPDDALCHGLPARMSPGKFGLRFATFVMLSCSLVSGSLDHSKALGCDRSDRCPDYQQRLCRCEPWTGWKHGGIISD